MKSKKLLSGLTLGALVGGAIGLFLAPSLTSKNTKKFKEVAKKLSGHLTKEAASFKKLGKKEFGILVENVMSKQSFEHGLDQKAWQDIKEELLARWIDVQKELKKASARTIKTARKGVAKKKV